MTSPHPKAVIFDWDNTLVDTWPVIQDALNHTFSAYGLETWSLDECRARVRESLRNSFPRYFGEKWEEAGEVFYARYGAIHAEKLTTAEGAGSMLETLHGMGLPLGVVSNKKGDFLRAEADKLDWARYFRLIVGALDAPRDKPDPAPVTMVLDAIGQAAGQDVWFVGDADIDLECAHNSGCVPVLLRRAAPDEGEFQKFPPTHYFPDAASLCKFLATR